MKFKMPTKDAIIGGNPLTVDDIDGWVRKASNGDDIAGYAVTDAIDGTVEMAVQGWRWWDGKQWRVCEEEPRLSYETS